jgi:hypothetical protein
MQRKLQVRVIFHTTIGFRAREEAGMQAAVLAWALCMPPWRKP